MGEGVSLGRGGEDDLISFLDLGLFFFEIEAFFFLPFSLFLSFVSPLTSVPSTDASDSAAMCE